MSAVKSKNRTHVFINQNFIIQVMQPDWIKPRLTTANKCINYIKDEKLREKLFKKLLEGKQQQYTMLIRNRLKINIWSK